jgi:hypothetical protein
LKYSLYFSYESALCRLLSIPVLHLGERVFLCLFKNCETQDFPTSFFATTEAKFCIMALVGGRPLLVKSLLYLTSSSSCCVLRFFRSCAASTHVLHLPWCLLLRVDSSTPNLSQLPHIQSLLLLLLFPNLDTVMYAHGCGRCALGWFGVLRARTR